MKKLNLFFVSQLFLFCTLILPQTLKAQFETDVRNPKLKDLSAVEELSAVSEIKMKDFIPEVIKKGKTIFNPEESEGVDSLLQKVNIWLKANPDLQIINIETVILPSLYQRRTDGDSQQNSLLIVSETSYYNYQIIRVWYRERNEN